jgi:hypothetical protein
MTTPSNGEQQNGGTGSGNQQPPQEGPGGQSGGSGELNIDWGGEVNTDAPKKFSKIGETVEATYAPSVEKATVTVDDDDPNTEAFTKQFKFGPAGQEQIQADVQQDKTDPRKVTVKVSQWPKNAEKLKIDWGGAATADQDSGSGSGGQTPPSGGDSGSGQQSGGQQA